MAYGTLRRCVVACLVVIACLGTAYAGETDQYMLWGVELEDSTEVFNQYLNDEIEIFLEKRNKYNTGNYSREEIAQGVYLHLFEGLHRSRIKSWLKHSPEVDRFPDDSVSSFRYHRMSIYRDLSVPYVILPLARTIRLNDIYLGIDKIGHFFGFGRRYYRRYLRYREEGLSEDEAVEKVIRTGVHLENTIVGKLVDGIFSHGDLEADYQGFMMLKDLAEAEPFYFIKEDGRWILTRPVDIRPYITPDFDESYNNCTYWGLRRGNVLGILENEYSEKFQSPEVQRRLARYRESLPSLSKNVIREYFEERGGDPQDKQSVQAICSRL